MLNRHRLNLLAGALILTATLVGYGMMGIAPAQGANSPAPLTLEEKERLKAALSEAGLLDEARALAKPN